MSLKQQAGRRGGRRQHGLAQHASPCPLLSCIQAALGENKKVSSWKVLLSWLGAMLEACPADRRLCLTQQAQVPCEGLTDQFSLLWVSGLILGHPDSMVTVPSRKFLHVLPRPGWLSARWTSRPQPRRLEIPDGSEPPQPGWKLWPPLAVSRARPHAAAVA